MRRDRSHGSTKLNRGGGCFCFKGLVRRSDCGSWMTPHYTQKDIKTVPHTVFLITAAQRRYTSDNTVCRVIHINADIVERTAVQKLSDKETERGILKNFPWKS